VETLASTEAIVPYSKVHGDEYGSSTSGYNAYCTTPSQSSSGSEWHGSTGACYFPHGLSPPEPTMSFIFVIDNLEMAPGCWEFLPRPPPVHNEPPALGPRTRRTNFIHINESAIYRWENGVTSHAIEHSFTSTPDSIPLKEYRAITMFYNGGFVLAEGDASKRDMRNQKYPRDRWFGLRFRHETSLSRVDLTSHVSYMAKRPNPWLVKSLGLGNYQNSDYSGSQNHGLNGNLAILLALIAFSCRCEALDKVLMSDSNGWNSYQWKPHPHGWDSRKSHLQSPFLVNWY
jgi:hypothetical protein